MPIHYHRFAAIPTPHLVGTECAGVPSRDRHGRQSPTPLEDPEMKEAIDLWSAWIDLGGEG
jgi:hypothetical protein